MSFFCQPNLQKTCILQVYITKPYKFERMKKQKLTFDELANKAVQLDKDDQLKVVGGRRGRGGSSSWGWGRGGIIEDDIVIRLRETIIIHRQP